MHPNPVFHTAQRTRNIAFARERGFGTLAINGPHVPLTAHVPILLAENGESAELHLMRSNPIVRTLADSAPGVITLLGPDSYISPDWYGARDQVPTWNYVSVRLTGTLSPGDPAILQTMLDRLSMHFEQRLRPKAPWSSAKMSDGVMTRMMRMIVPLRFEVSLIEGTWKLNQNKPHEARLSAADYVAGYGMGQELSILAGLMRGAGEDDHETL